MFLIQKSTDPSLSLPSSLETKIKINAVVEPIKLAEEPTNIIKIVGKTMKEAIKNVDGKDEALEKIGQVIYASRYNLSSNSDVSRICGFTKRTPEEVESSIQLVKKIERKINE